MLNADPHILVVDDDREIRALLRRYLVGQGYRVTVAADGVEMRRAVQDRGIDLVVLDLMLPGEDGLALCRWLRGNSHLPVIMLTARGDDIDRIVGLEMGADDYMPKPFNPRELVARIKAVLRRAGTPAGGLSGDRPVTAGTETVTFAGWLLELNTRQLTSPEGALVPLTAGEYGLLAAFVSHPHRVLSREQLLDLARGREVQPFDRSIDVQVSRLRRKIEADAQDPRLIKTIRGGGYMFTPAVEHR